MLIKIAIICAVLIIGSFMFSSEISGIFPNTSESVPTAIQDDADQLGEKVVRNMGQKVDDSINKIEDSVNNSIKSSKESIEKINSNPVDSLGSFFRNLIGTSNS